MKNTSKQRISRFCLSCFPQQMVLDYCKSARFFRREAIRAQLRGWDESAEQNRNFARADYEVASRLKLCLRRQELESACLSAAAPAKALLSRGFQCCWISVERNSFCAWLTADSDSHPLEKSEDFPTIEQAAAFLIERAGQLKEAA
jgi:hypothetical protein